MDLEKKSNKKKLKKGLGLQTVETTDTKYVKGDSPFVAEHRRQCTTNAAETKSCQNTQNEKECL